MSHTFWFKPFPGSLVSRMPMNRKYQSSLPNSLEVLHFKIFFFGFFTKIPNHQSNECSLVLQSISISVLPWQILQEVVGTSPDPWEIQVVPPVAPYHLVLLPVVDSNFPAFLAVFCVLIRSLLAFLVPRPVSALTPSFRCQHVWTVHVIVLPLKWFEQVKLL